MESQEKGGGTTGEEDHCHVQRDNEDGSAKIGGDELERCSSHQS